MMTDDDALFALAHIAEPADVGVGQLVDHVGAVGAIERIARGAAPRGRAAILGERLRRFDADRERARAEQLGVHVVVRNSSEWPTQLDDLRDRRPYALWVLGAADLRLTALRSVSVVGTRSSTPYGEHVTREWCGAFVDHGLTVVSGGAFGIDAAAHRAVLANAGMTICVLAGGVDMPYPRAHEALIGRIADEGLVISESPLGESVRRQRFLTRNRLIAALSRGTVIVESALRSGTSSTAVAAAELNRPVFAVPGPITSPTSAGCHQMLAAGLAVLVDRPRPVIDTVLARTTIEQIESPRDPRDDLSGTQASVLDAMPSRGVIDASELAVRAGVQLPAALAALGQLEGHGFVRLESGGWKLAQRA